MLLLRLPSAVKRSRSGFNHAAHVIEPEWIASVPVQTLSG